LTLVQVQLGLHFIINPTSALPFLRANFSVAGASKLCSRIVVASFYSNHNSRVLDLPMRTEMFTNSTKMYANALQICGGHTMNVHLCCALAETKEAPPARITALKQGSMGSIVREHSPGVKDEIIDTHDSQQP
jgi:hypothetical protein